MCLRQRSTCNEAKRAFRFSYFEATFVDTAGGSGCALLLSPCSIRGYPSFLPPWINSRLNSLSLKLMNHKSLFALLPNGSALCQCPPAIEITRYSVSTMVTNHILLIPYSFEKVAKFKYLGTTLTNQNDIHDEIKSRLNLENACYY
jgi:hypothetical protein